MKIIKNGIKKFETYYEVTFDKYVCPDCECEFEVQQTETGRISVSGQIECPYCKMKHIEEAYKKYEGYRTQWMQRSDVINYDPAKNPEKIVEVLSKDKFRV